MNQIIAAYVKKTEQEKKFNFRIEIKIHKRKRVY